MHDRHSARTTPSSHEANSAREIVAPPEGSESIRPPMQAVRAPRCRATLPNQTPNAATAAAPAAPNLQRSPPMAGYRHSPYGTSRGSDADLATEDVDVSLTAPPPYGPTSPRQHLQNQHHPPHHQQLRQTGGDQHHHPIRQHQHHPMHHQQHQHQGHPMQQQQQQQQQHPLNVTYPHQHHPQRNSPHSGGFSGAASGWKNPSASAGCCGPPHASPGWVGAGPALPPSASPPTRFAPPPPPPSRLSRELCCADSDTPAHLVGELLYSLGRRWTHKVENWLNHHPRLRPSVPPPSASTYVTVEAWLERLGCWYEANFGNIARQQSRTQRRHRYSDSASRGSFAAASRESASPSLSGSAASLEGM